MEGGIGGLQGGETDGSFVAEACECVVGFGEDGRGEEGGDCVALVWGEAELGFEGEEVCFCDGVGYS